MEIMRYVFVILMIYLIINFVLFIFFVIDKEFLSMFKICLRYLNVVK